MIDRPPDLADIVGITRMEREVLQLLLQRVDDWPWCPIEEVMHATADPIVALDAMDALCEAGLIRRTGENVMVTVAAHAFHLLITGP